MSAMTDKIKITQVIAVSNQKGGVGKTSLLLMLASLFSDDGAKVACVDSTFKQQHFYNACSKNAMKNVDYLSENEDEKLVRGIKSLKDDGEYDFILVDTAGILTTTSSYMITLAGLILIPCDADPDSAADSVVTINFANTTLNAIDKNTPMYVVMNNVKKGTNISSEVIKALDETGVPRFRNIIGSYTDFPNMKKNGFLKKGGNGWRTASAFLAELQNIDAKNVDVPGYRPLLPYYARGGGFVNREHI